MRQLKSEGKRKALSNIHPMDIFMLFSYLIFASLQGREYYLHAHKLKVEPKEVSELGIS